MNGSSISAIRVKDKSYTPLKIVDQSTTDSAEVHSSRKSSSDSFKDDLKEIDSESIEGSYDYHNDSIVIENSQKQQFFSRRITMR